MAKKEAKIKSLFNDENYLLYLDMVKKSQIPYSIKQSNYTLEINSAFINIQFMQNIMSEKAFIANQMILRDIKNNQLLPPDIDRQNLNYYKFAIPEKLKQANNTVFNIDIKSAYAAVLFNHGIITDKTNAYLNTIAKKDRLACVGMLAGKKNIFEYDSHSELINVELTENPNAGFFYFCIWQVQNIMNKIRAEIGNAFLFYWVDGIYFDDESKKPVIEQILINNGYNYSFDTLREFSYKEHEKRFIIYYKKEGEQKIFNVPKPNTEIAKQLIDFLSLHESDTETIKKLINHLSLHK